MDGWLTKKKKQMAHKKQIMFSQQATPEPQQKQEIGCWM